jgi:hypothetical protein
MRDYCIEMGLYFDEEGKLRRRVARPQARIESQLAISRAVAVESSRGPRISKENRRMRSTWWSPSGPPSPRSRLNPSTHIQLTRYPPDWLLHCAAVVMTGGRTLWRAS